ncbi:hypothetical protein B0J17DRAFT_768115 [Rhizoctonia solani]|nr:hypothetical protein B0J17DRAFT_768115 [Rhizoctonia solani]
MQFFGESQFPSLTFLSMKFTGPYEHDYADNHALVSEVDFEPGLLFRESPTQLRSVKLQGVPASYLFGHSLHPQFVSLTDLELRFEIFYPMLADFNKLLAANPELETISLTSKDTFGPVEIDGEHFPHICLPKLRSLSVILVAPHWILRVIMMVDVPNITSLELRLGIVSREQNADQVGIRGLFDYIVGDEIQGTPAPRFPSLRSLTIASEMSQDFEDDLTAVLHAYPQLTELTLPSCLSLSPLLEQPWLVPGIEQLRVGCDSLAQLQEVVDLRRGAGLPLRTVLFNIYCCTSAIGWSARLTFDD